MAGKTQTPSLKEFNELPGGAVFLSAGKALVVMSDYSDLVTDRTFSPIAVEKPKDGPGKDINFVPRGSNNKLPTEIMDKVYKNVAVASSIDFNAKIAYGDGVIVCKKERDATGKVVFTEQLESEQPEIFKFLEDNNIKRTIEEWANDLVVFAEGYCEIIITKDGKKIYSIAQKEVTQSRVSQANEKTGKIEYHGYSAKWEEGSQDDITTSVLLESSNPIIDLKRQLGLVADAEGKTNETKERRFVFSLGMPTPGRFYYNKPYWWSIFTSGWFDFACAIPTYKKALIKNQMVLKYHVQINESFWAKAFKSDGITDDKGKKKWKKTFLQNLNDFLSGEENTGKSFVSHFEYDKIKGAKAEDVIITPIENFFKGGEYLEDSEEASNVIYSAMGVHPSIIGASPGKNKSINGTEARELFIIKQAMTKPIRDMLLTPLYLAKAIQGWSADIHFVIPNIMLTTVDQGTGAVKSIGNQKV